MTLQRSFIKVTVKVNMFKFQELTDGERDAAICYVLYMSTWQFNVSLTSVKSCWQVTNVTSDRTVITLKELLTF